MGSASLQSYLLTAKPIIRTLTHFLPLKKPRALRRDAGRRIGYHRMVLSGMYQKNLSTFPAVCILKSKWNLNYIGKSGKQNPVFRINICLSAEILCNMTIKVSKLFLRGKLLPVWNLSLSHKAHLVPSLY